MITAVLLAVPICWPFGAIILAGILSLFKLDGYVQSISLTWPRDPADSMPEGLQAESACESSLGYSRWN